MIFFMSFIASLSVLFDAVIVTYFWLGIADDTMLFSIAHLAAILIGLVSLLIILKKRHSKTPASYFFLILSLSVLLPLLGLLMSCILVLLNYKFHLGRTEQHIRTVGLHYENDAIKSLYGVGGVRARLLSPNFSVSSKTAALFAIGNTKSQITNIILQEILHDKQEDLRLLAFGLLEYQGRDIYNHISATLELLETTTAPLERAHLQKQVAQFYWELVHRGLNSDMESLFLGYAQRYTEEALKMLDDNVSLWVLLGKIYHRLKNDEQAQQMFKKAQSLGAPFENFIFYLAEIAYRQRDFVGVVDYFQTATILSDIPTIGPVARFWTRGCDVNNEIR